MSANATAAHEAPPTQRTSPRPRRSRIRLARLPLALSPPPAASARAPAHRRRNPRPRHRIPAQPRSRPVHLRFRRNLRCSVGRHSERSVPSSSLREAPGHQAGLPGRRSVEPGRSVEEPLFDAADSAEPASLPRHLRSQPAIAPSLAGRKAYRETFATPEAARAATAQLADLNHMDALFFSRRPEDHAELARVVATLDPNAFAG